jgi:hypothetical protein
MTRSLLAAVMALGLLWAPAADAHSVSTGLPAPGVPISEPVRDPPPEREPAPSGGSAGPLLVLAAFGAGIAGAGASRRLRRSAGALASAGLLLVFLAGSAPHLVHHTFDADRGADCQTLQVASHADGAVDGPPAPLIVMDSLPVVHDPRPPVVVAAAPTARTRAPPA